jgi:hypothetical protein
MFPHRVDPEKSAAAGAGGPVAKLAQSCARRKAATRAATRSRLAGAAKL